MAATEPRITVRPNGPYAVVGDVTVVAKAQIETELGEPIAWEVGAEIGHKERMRCAAAASRDASRSATARISGSNSRPRTRCAPARRRSTTGTGVTLYDDRDVCVHAGFCGTTITNVWKMVRKTDDTTVRSMLVAMVERCPSGAISYSIDGEADNEPRLPSEIGVMVNGPLWVTGGIPVDVGDEGTLQTRNRVALCRCGASSRKPLCDGSRKEAGFVDDPRDRE